MSKPHTLEDCRADRHDWGLDYCRVSGRGDQPVIEMLVYCHTCEGYAEEAVPDFAHHGLTYDDHCDECGQSDTLCECPI